MGNIYKAFQTDKEAELNGVWHKIFDCDFLIARFGNEDYSRALNAKKKKLRNKLNYMSDKELSNMTIPIVAEHILKGWKNVNNDNDEPIEYNLETAITLLSELPDLLEEILKISMDMENYKKSTLEESAKN